MVPNLLTTAAALGVNEPQRFGLRRWLLIVCFPRFLQLLPPEFNSIHFLINVKQLISPPEALANCTEKSHALPPQHKWVGLSKTQFPRRRHRESEDGGELLTAGLDPPPPCQSAHTVVVVVMARQQMLLIHLLYMTTEEMLYQSGSFQT